MHTFFGLIVLVCSLASPPARAPTFAIDLNVQCGKASQTAHAETTTPGEKAKPRGTLTVAAGQPVRVRWMLRHVGTSGVKDLLVHFFVVKEERANQPEVPKTEKDVIAESALTMDFSARDKAQGQMVFSIARPGYYLLRLETIGAVGKNGPEYFAAIDLFVQ